ncbi:MAG: hypothetical protein OER88_08140 [Planctomycetota bacterium]|nr:hypothetical protein [Planctomycetota bacterium]
MTHYQRLKNKRLGDILVDEGLASKEAVIAALQQQQTTGRLMSESLLEAREINDYDLARAIVEQYQAPFIDLSKYTLHKDLIEEFPAELLHRARVLPLDRFGKQVCFACQEVPSADIAEALGKISEGGLYFFVASAYDLRQKLDDYATLQPMDGAPVFGDIEEDSGWQNLFDSANESVVNELPDKE